MMIAPRDPFVAQDNMALVKLWHALDGIFLWEFFTTLDYEWDVIRGRRPYGWTIWVYSLTRIAGLMSVILNFVGLDVTTPINCQVWISSELSFCYTSATAASLLIVLRIIAIWNRNKFVIATAYSLLGINVAFFIQSAARTRATWAPEKLACENDNTQTNTLSLIAMVVTDISLLLLMLFGLFRIRFHGVGMIGLSQLLWKQGVLWLLIATIAEVPPAVFIVLDLNVQFNVIFQAPSLIIMSIAATRMHRSLVNFAGGSSEK
ncbi:hypothetical protein BC826DRAFT_341154 [Russula brevipes]|nr:hypothetical protein BC826DRAFT_341154 [Russula brevipes]